MKKIIPLILLAFSFSACATSAVQTTEPISDFKSDGCSSYPDKSLTGTGSWLHCCMAHDIAYWMGGTEEQREDADLELKACVSEATNPIRGRIMYSGVRVGGLPKTHLPWRWAYGYESQRGYQKITSSEYQMIMKKYDSIKIEINNWRSELTEEQENYILEIYEDIISSLEETTLRD